jgi:N-acetylglucosaminyldiphosphoundecaprenol N-acetyl-beta-D-mannosaminyltransferase
MPSFAAGETASFQIDRKGNGLVLNKVLRKSPELSGYGGEPGAENTVELLGMSVANLSIEEVRARVDARIQSREPGYVVTPNVDHVCRLARDKALQRAYREAFLVLVDGIPLMWTARLKGVPLKQKLSGSDLIYWLSEHAAARGYSVYLLGAGPGVAQETAAKLCERYPGLKVAGVQSPPMGFDSDPEANAEVVQRLREARPDICFVALGSPRQEIWIHKHCKHLEVPVIIGVGASFDFVSGRVRRAPRLLQYAGLEWLWRLCLEPRRLWRRYLIYDSRFVLIALADLWLARRMVRQGKRTR